MEIEEFKKILNDKDMQHCRTNIKVYKKGDKSNITVAQLYKEFVAFASEQRKFNEQTNKKFEIIFDLFKQHKWIQ